MTRRLTEHRRSMLGMDGDRPRCVALVGEVGGEVYCSIYERRSSVCREFEPSFENGSANERCDRARAAWGLRPLTPDDWASWRSEG